MKKSVKKSVKKKAPARKITAYAQVLRVVSRSRKGATVAQLKKKTGFNDKKIANIIYKGRKLGDIKSEKKGIYVKT
ncbi:MAG: hypothetical protein GY859_39345 [Desulfobacterales bacterium]|nr:hypothetical protein [Desulfobacterales bacterium]